MAQKKRNYEYVHRTISQPVDHSDSEGMSFDQHIDIIIPEGCSSSAPVFFHLGEEHELEEETLLMFYDAYDKRNYFITFLIAFILLIVFANDINHWLMSF